GVANVSEISETAAERSLEVLKQISSTGYLRKRLPQELVVLQGGQSGATALAGAEDPVGALATLVPETATQGGIAPDLTSPSKPASAPVMDARTKARMQGYEGEACGECGNYTLVRNGTCMKCNTCGSTTRCS
ncbi:MAG TPA: vitamin B12-dependent ribonucleotide reductase, partial [Aliiroseovarius sp.]|nr:vitamin B12-dependent ribonucleotide reductase [Aliiroseovarius sp.]